VVSGGHGGNPEAKHLPGGFPRHTRAAGHVLAVGQHYIRLQLSAQAGKEKPDRSAARLGVDVADEENPHYLA
jgi:hypothetical protein